MKASLQIALLRAAPLVATAAFAGTPLPRVLIVGDSIYNEPSRAAANIGSTHKK